MPMRSPGAPSHRREVERELLSTDQDARRTKRSRVGPPCSSLVVAVSLPNDFSLRRVATTMRRPRMSARRAAAA